MLQGVAEERVKLSAPYRNVSIVCVGSHIKRLGKLGRSIHIWRQELLVIWKDAPTVFHHVSCFRLKEKIHVLSITHNSLGRDFFNSGYIGFKVLTALTDKIYLLGQNSVHYGQNDLLRRNLSPLSSGSKSNWSKKSAWSRKKARTSLIFIAITILNIVHRPVFYLKRNSTL
jgi:hypothetical protein